ncbi:MAG: hypothetical protein JNK82_36940 [Myxococcaceae bacterium]|nr:hypothetical protein [Myxococcaceae bacterium]
MRLFKPSLTLAVVLIACGPIDPAGPAADSRPGGGGGTQPAPAPGPSGACGDGAGPSVPADFPQLGTGCRSHFVYRWYFELFGTRGSVDELDARGVRRIDDAPFSGTYDLGSQSDSDEYHPVVMFLPSLAPGVYRAGDGVGLKHELIGSYTTGFANGETGALVEIVGASADAVWGRFIGRACEQGPSPKACYHFEQGRFAAARDTTPSDLEFGYPVGRGANLEVCETRADCPVHGELPPLCTSGLCSGAPTGPM